MTHKGKTCNHRFSDEQLEMLLGQYEFSLRQLETSRFPEDRKDLERIRTLLNEVAERTHLRTIQEIVRSTQTTGNLNFDSRGFRSCDVMIALTTFSYWQDVGIIRNGTADPNSFVVNEVSRLLLDILHRHKVIAAASKHQDDGTLAVESTRGILISTEDFNTKPVDQVLTP